MKEKHTDYAKTVHETVKNHTRLIIWSNKENPMLPTVFMYKI